MYISQKKRAELLELLERTIPVVTDPNLRSLYVLLAALLCDHQAALLDRKTLAEKYLEHLNDLRDRLNRMAQRLAEPGETQDQLPQ